MARRNTSKGKVKKLGKNENIRNKNKDVMYDFITLGSATIDAFVYTTDTEVIKIQHPHFFSELLAYPLGTKIIIKDLDFQVGGGGTNSAVSLAKLGFEVAFYGCLGKDYNANIVLDLLKKYKIDFIGKQKGTTGFSVILDSFVDDRTVLTYKGANDYVDDNITINAKAVYSSSLTNNAFKSQLNIFRKVKKKGALVFYNPSSYVVKMGLKKLLPLLNYTDFLIFNLEEARILSNKTEIREIFKVLKKIHSLKHILVTNGPDGVYFDNGKFIWHIFGHKVKVVETTGAGDTFGSTFSGIYLLTNDVVKSVEMAMLNAESVIQKRGAKNGLLNLEQLKLKYRNTTFKIEKIKF